VADRAAWTLGRLLLTTVNQSDGAPRVDGARCEDAEGNRYTALVFGAGGRAPVIGWRGAPPVPPPARLVLAAPRPLRPAMRWLVGPRWASPAPMLRPWIAGRLRTWADRLDHAGAPKVLGWSFTFEEGEGIRFRQDGRGCRLAYLGGEDNYERAHDEADRPAVPVDWRALAAPPAGGLRGRLR
jgi:hypothetical protein